MPLPDAEAETGSVTSAHHGGEGGGAVNSGPRADCSTAPDPDGPLVLI